MARAFNERASLIKCHKEKANLLHEAVDKAKKGFSFEADNHSAGAHNWYAIALLRLQGIDKKAHHSTDIIKHLEMASKLGWNDAFTVNLPILTHYNKNSHTEAL
ncbi:hypothetical protein Angca_001809, partial [Angiostrongylus cantonensis]